jgi:ketosteroid isomerase-like protein
MSRENVEIVKRALDAFSRGDADAFAELTTADIEWKTGLGAVWDLRGGKIWRLRAYLDHVEATEVAGS